MTEESCEWVVQSGDDDECTGNGGLHYCGHTPLLCCVVDWILYGKSLSSSSAVVVSTTVRATAIEHVAAVTDRVVCDVPCFADGLVNE